MHVLLTTSRDADERKTVASVRALGRRGVRVTLGSDERGSPGGWSRYCHRRLLLPSALNSTQEFAGAVRREVMRTRYDVLLPMSDDTMSALVHHTEGLTPHVATVLPDVSAYETTRDKLLLTKLALELGVGVPKTHAPEDLAALEALAPTLRYPCVLKLRRGAAAVGLAFPENADALRAAYRSRPRRRDVVVDGSQVLVQEYVPGELHDVGTVCDRGRVVAAMTQQRVVMHPPGGGVGVVNETTDQPELVADARRVLEALGWHGPAQVEFRVDPVTGRRALLEVNGRPWGTFDVAIRAGFDVPWILCLVARREDVPTMRPAVGLRYRWPWPYGWQALRGGIDRRAALRDFFWPAPGVKTDVDMRDPMPHLVGGWRWLRARARSAARGHTS